MKQKQIMAEMHEFMGEMRTHIKYIREKVKENSKDAKEIQKQVANHNKILNSVKTNLDNHLKEHERLRKEMLVKLGLLVSAIGIITSIILKLIFR